MKLILNKYTHKKTNKHKDEYNRWCFGIQYDFTMKIKKKNYHPFIIALKIFSLSLFQCDVSNKSIKMNLSYQ